MTKRIPLYIVAALFLSSCGIKPGSVDPPTDAGKTGYPRTYPDLRTDPPPPPNL